MAAKSYVSRTSWLSFNNHQIFTQSGALEFLIKFSSRLVRFFFKISLERRAFNYFNSVPAVSYPRAPILLVLKIGTPGRQGKKAGFSWNSRQAKMGNFPLGCNLIQCPPTWGKCPMNTRSGFQTQVAFARHVKPNKNCPTVKWVAYNM